MADEELNFADEVSEFLQKSCPQRPTWRSELTQHFHRCSCQTRHPVTGAQCKRFPVNTGSAAELFIDPMLSCVDDVDVMYHYSNELAVPAGDTPPEQLPKEFDRCVKVFEVVDSHLPGYVYLAYSYTLKKSDVDGKCVVQCVEQAYRSTFLNHDLYIRDLQERAEVHGPARKYKHDIPFFFDVILHIDAVPCIRCLKWPSQAADWPTRHRIEGWPDAATIDAVVGNGCDMVGVAHPLCRDDRWMAKHQWRLSFSRAEVTLLHSWTPEQQIIYHMLRTFVKTERLTKGSNNYGADTFSNYHIKTLMLWACEITPRYWWNNGPNVVSLCVKLIHYLNEWLTKWHGQHYFISNVHFCEYFDTTDIDTACSVAKSITVSNLAQWFVDNYICKCAELCPQNISVSCNDIITRKILQDTVMAILKWKDHIALKVLMKEICLQFFSLNHLAPLNLILYFPFKYMTNFTGLRNFQHDYISQFLLLFIGFCCNTCMFDKIGQYPEENGFIWRSVLATCISRTCSDDERRIISSDMFSSASSFMKAITFIKYGIKRQHNISGVLLIELAKAYLLRALRYKDSDIDSIYCVANTYLAVLCYATGQYQKATDHCTLVTRSQDHSQCSSQFVHGNLLPMIDDDINSALGLAVLYQYVRGTSLFLHDGLSEHIGVFTTELFAHYFIVKRLMVMRSHTTAAVANNITQTVMEQLQMYGNRLLHSKNLSVSDLLLCKLSKHSHLLRATRRKIVFSWTPAEVIKLLTQYSIEYVMELHPLVLHGPVVVGSINGLLPLYLYRCRLYDRCLELCQDSVHDLVHTDVRLSTSYHEFIQLMDEGIVSAVGLAVLV